MIFVRSAFAGNAPKRRLVLQNLEYHKDGIPNSVNRISSLHREDGPAYESMQGHKAWYKNGLLHRKDGPALIYPNGIVYFYLEGNPLTEEEFHTHLK